MSFKLFDVPTMVAVSGPWLDPSQDRPVLAALPLVAPLLSELESAHSALVGIGAGSSDRDARLAAFSEEAQALDLRHDVKLKGVFSVLTAWAELLDDADLALSLFGVRDRLFPEGQSGVQRSYLSEASHVEMTRENLTEDILSRLGAISCNGTTLADEADAWMAAGRELGQVERERMQLASNKDEASFSAAEVNKARTRWSQVTEAMLKLITLTADLDDATRIRILEPLQSAEDKVARRRRAAGAAPTEPEPEPDTTTESE